MAASEAQSSRDIQRRDWREVRRLRHVGLDDAEAHLDRLNADSDLKNRLALQGYSGPEWNRFAELLARYGLGVLRAWCMTGKIFDECDRVGRVLSRSRIDEDDATDLAVETVAKAVDAFREKVLIGNKWDPRRGASLKTFFVGQCKFQFPNVYRPWLNLQRSHERAITTIRNGASATNTATERVNLDPLREFIDSIDDPLTRGIVFLKHQGFPEAAIAEMCETTLPTVKNRLYQIRKQHRDIA